MDTCRFLRLAGTGLVAWSLVAGQTTDSTSCASQKRPVFCGYPAHAAMPQGDLTKRVVQMPRLPPVAAWRLRWNGRGWSALCANIHYHPADECFCRSMEAAALIARYGYAAVFAGTLLEGETLLLLAAYAAHRGYLDWATVVVVAWLGATLGDQLWFALGRYRGACAPCAHHPSL
jgi:hypothetical protein